MPQLHIKPLIDALCNGASEYLKSLEKPHRSLDLLSAFRHHNSQDKKRAQKMIDTGSRVQTELDQLSFAKAVFTSNIGIELQSFLIDHVITNQAIDKFSSEAHTRGIQQHHMPGALDPGNVGDLRDPRAEALLDVINQAIGMSKDKNTIERGAEEIKADLDSERAVMGLGRK